VAPNRRRRPGAEDVGVADEPTEAELDECPFCEGREDRTPPETFRVGGLAGWLVRVVPNLYPAFERQEVVVHSPRHVRTFAELTDDELARLDGLGVAGDRGFRGHVRALAEGRLTTGFIKLFGGAGVAVVLVATPGFASGRRLITDAVLIALAANFANLLDLAPGRLIKVSWVLYIPLAVALGTDAIGVAIAPVMGAALALLPDDLRERLMLGDTGANVIGAVLGLGVVLGLGKEARTSVLVVLIVLNVLARLLR